MVVHLDPQHRSELPILSKQHTDARYSGRSTRGAAGRPRLRHFAGSTAAADRPRSAAEEFEQPRGQRSPINLFFRSLAEQFGDGFAIILSGAGSDGALGARAMKEAGGIILVQDPNEAEYASMPRSAIATGVADL